MIPQRGFGVRTGCIGLAVAALLATVPAVEGGYLFQTIDVPGAVGDTFGAGVNASGLVSGYYVDANGNYNGFIWQNGRSQTIDYNGVAGVVSTLLFQDNSSGKVAGYYIGSDGNSHSLIYNSAGGTWTTVPDAPGAYPFNAAGGINDNGKLAGNYSTDPTAATNLVGWLYDIKSNSYTSFTVPQADQSLAGTATYGMNNKGDIAGGYTDANDIYHGFVWDPTTGSRTIDVPGATGGTVLGGINDAGTVVGNYFIGTTSYGFILDSHGDLTSFMYAGATSTWITGIDDAGDITGFFQDANGFHGFYGQSVPEPSSLVLALTGIAGVAVHARTRRRRA